MRVGPVILFLLLILIGLGFLLGDNIHLNRELALASEQQMITVQQIQTLNQQSMLLQQKIDSVSSEQEKLKLELQLATLDVQLLQQQNKLLTQSGEKMALSGRIMLTGYVEYEETNLGKVVLTYPQSISLGDSKVVILTLIPNNVVYRKSTASTMYEKSVGSSIDLPDEIEISPIMAAKISGVGFDIVENANEQAVNPDRPTEWIWTVSGKEEGRHILVANIAVPISIEGNQEVVDAKVHLYPIEIEVIKPLKSWLNGLLPYILPAVMTGIVSYFVGISVSAKKQKNDGFLGQDNKGGFVKLSKGEREAIIRMRRSR